MKTRSRIFLLDDDDLILSMLGRGLREDGYEVRAEATASGVVSAIRSWRPDIILLDIHLPEKSGIDILQELNEDGIRTPVVMLTADESAETAVKAMKLGAVDYLVKPFEIDEVVIVIRNVLEKERLKREVDCLRRVSAETVGQDIIGESAAIRDPQSELGQMAEAAVSTVLITGESGTGKELFARRVHRLMHSHNDGEFAPFVRINCAALPETLLESELFGHERGAFTDAKTEKKGLFELAQGGSLLLDEIGEMKLGLQSKLLRVLEDRTVRHVGGRHEIPVEVTVIATTNRNLGDAVEQGEFRMDLFYRLNAFWMRIPTLRERREDIPLLAEHFLSSLTAKYNKKVLKKLSPEAKILMAAYHWPGNVRELKNVIERLVVLGGSEVIMIEHLPPEMRKLASTPAAVSGTAGFILPEDGISLADLENSLIIQALQRTNYNKTQAAKLLHVNYDIIRYHAKKMGLPKTPSQG